MATQMGMRVRQGDVPTVYVKADLAEEIYMKQPRGFEEVHQSKFGALKSPFTASNKPTGNGTWKSTSFW